MTYIVACVFANGESRISASADLRRTFDNWTRRYGDCLPVAAFPADPDAFRRAANILRLPKATSTEWAADLLHRAPVSMTAQPAVFRHIRKLGPKAGPLFQDWARAVRGVRV